LAGDDEAGFVHRHVGREDLVDADAIEAWHEGAEHHRRPMPFVVVLSEDRRRPDLVELATHAAVAVDPGATVPVERLVVAHEQRPASKAVFACDRELGVSKLELFGVPGGEATLPRADAGHRVDVTALRGAQKLFGLLALVFAIGVRRERPERGAGRSSSFRDGRTSARWARKEVGFFLATPRPLPDGKLPSCGPGALRRRTVQDSLRAGSVRTLTVFLPSRQSP
jgi:hypothetical protein